MQKSIIVWGNKDLKKLNRAFKNGFEVTKASKIKSYHSDDISTRFDKGVVYILDDFKIE